MSKMSCFGGRMQEYDRISLDRFDGKNLQSTVYFLSHLHEDHTVGLAEPIFHKRLKSNKDIFLYCSEVTQVLLVASKKYRHLKPFIKGLSINTPTTIVIPDPLFEEKEKITVTLLPAFHCPGSVMFLIEGVEGTVLYTGDFRWEHFNIEQMHHLRSGESVKKIKSLYVDTTFCSPENLYIPSRQQCIDAVCQLVQEWTSISPKHIVNIYLRAQYGHEPLLNAVASRLGKKVHVNEHKVEVYNRIQEFHGNFTSDGINTQLHACNRDCMIEVDGKEVLCREAHDSDKVLVVLPTTMYFTQFAHLTLDKIIKKINSNFFRACYSFHSSYTEVKDLISYLKPEKVFPNVKPPNDKSLAVTQYRLNKMLKECMEMGAGETIYTREVKELGTLKTRSGRQANKRKVRESTSDAESLDFGTPVKSAKLSASSPMKTGEPASPVSSTSKKKGRGRGRGRGLAETASQPATGTRRSTRRLAATPPSQEITPKKSKKSERSPTPDLFLTPASDISDQHSSFCGSERSDSELSLFSSQKSDIHASDEAGISWTAGSFLAAITSSSEDDTSAGRYCLIDDDEQTDEHFEDSCPSINDEEEGEDVISEQSESIIPKDDVDGDPDTSGKKSKGTKTSPVKSVRRGKRAKVIPAKEDDISSGPEQEHDTGEDKEHSKERNTNVKDEKVDKLEDLKTEVKDNGKVSLETLSESEELVPKVDTALRKKCTDEDDIGDGGDKSFVSNDSVKHFDDKISLSVSVTVNPDEKLKTDMDRQNYLGVPLDVTHVSIIKSSATNRDKDVQGEKNEPSDTCEESKDIVIESSEELHLHLSESTHDSVKDFVDKNVDFNVDDVVTITSDSEDEVTNEDQENNYLEKTKAVNVMDTELVDEIVCINSEIQSDSASPVQEKDSVQSADTEEHMMVRGNGQNVTVKEDQVDKDGNDVAVEIVNLESLKSKRSEGLINNDKTDTVTGSDGDKVIQDDQSDDIIEIVDLTGDDNAGQVENRENVKPGKKTIKISLLTKTENLKKNRRNSKAKEEVEKAEIYAGNDEDSESDEMESSQEWLSVKKARVRKDVIVARKTKKMKGSKANATLSMGSEKGGFNDSECMDTYEDKSETEQISKLELEERAEVRRQAVGFMCETDSESDTDESTDPGSPEADLLYDDYVELSSDSDHEGGISGKGVGKNSKTHKRTGSKSYQFGNSKSGNNNQGWLTSRKHTPGSESTLQETEIIERTNDDILEQLPLNEMSSKTDENDQTPIRNESKDSMNEQTENASADEKQDMIDFSENTFSSKNSGVTEIPTIDSHQKAPFSKSDGILFEQSINKEPVCSVRDSDLQQNESGAKETPTMTSNSTTNIAAKTIKADDFPTSDTLNESIKEPSNSKSLLSENESDKLVDFENVIIDDSIAEGITDDKAKVTNIEEQTEIWKDDAIVTRIKNSGKKVKSDYSDVVNNDTEEKAKVDSAETSTENILMQGEKSFKSNESCEDGKILQSATEAGEKLSSIRKQNSNEMKENSDIVKNDGTPFNKETLPFIAKRKVDSVSLSTADNANVYKAKSKQPKIIDWRKLPPANSSKISFVSDIINYNDQPAPPGTEELTQPLKPSEPPNPSEPSRTESQIKTISSVIRSRSSKVFQKKTPVSQPSSSAISNKPLYNLFVGGAKQSVNAPSYNYSYPNSAHVSPVQNYPPPGWGLYPYGPRPTPPFPFPTAPTQPPPSLPYPSTVPIQTVCPTLPTSTVVTVPSFPPPSVTFSISPSVATSTATQSTMSKTSDTSTLKHSVNSGLASKSKKLAPWQQKRADMFERGPSCIAKKEVKQKRTIKIGISQKPMKEDKVMSQSNGIVPYKQNESGITDIATIKANISALTGLSVVSTVNTKPSIPADCEELPALLEQLSKLKKAQAVIDAMKPQSENNLYGMSKQTEFVDSVRHVDDDRMSAWSGRLSRDGEFEREHRQISNRYEEREREDRQRSIRYEEREREDRRCHSRDYSEYERRERSYGNYDQWDGDFRYSEKRERDLDYEKDRELRRDTSYERRSREFIRDDREYFEYDRREREFELRYREDEEYRMWLEERRRKEAYRRFSRDSPPRYPRYDDPYHGDPYYDRFPRDPEYEEWIERRRQMEYPGRVRHDSYERYEDQPRQRPAERPRSHSLYDNHPTRLQNETTETRFGDLHHPSRLGGNDYSAEIGSDLVELRDTRTSQVSEPSNRFSKLPVRDYSQKNPIMARVYSRSGQFLSSQPGWKATNQPATATSTSEREDTADQPVFLTGMNYYSTPEDQ